MVLSVIAGSCPQETDSESRLPFANCGNPVMSMVSGCRQLIP